MATVLFPMLIRDPGSAWRKTWQSALIVSAVMIAAFIGVWWLGAWIITAVFGASFEPAYHILLWLMPAVLATSVTSILSQFVVAEGFPRSLVALWLGGFALCAGLGVPLANAKGPIGVAQATSLSAVFVCLGVLALTVRRLQGHARQPFASLKEFTCPTSSLPTLCPCLTAPNSKSARAPRSNT